MLSNAYNSLIVFINNSNKDNNNNNSNKDNNNNNNNNNLSMYLPVLMNVFWPADWLFKQTVLKKKNENMQLT